MFCTWGNIEGHAADSGYAYSQETYNATPGAAITTDLTDEQDIVHVYLGGSCRLPTYEELEELVENTSSIWTTYNGVYGRLFTSNINGQVLFLPAVGYFPGANRASYGVLGFYWTRSYSNASVAHDLNIKADSVNPQSTYYRYYGFAIRPVLDENPNRSVIPPTPEDKPKEEDTPTEEEPKDNNER